MNITNQKHVNIIGAGLAGCAAALKLSDLNVKSRLYEAKPLLRSAAHSSDDFCELVCSNSLKSEDISTASGLLKAELSLLGCKVLEIANKNRVPAGGALAVDRVQFAKSVTNEIKNDKNIEVVNEVCLDFDDKNYTIIASGPLTLEPLLSHIKSVLNADMYFYDAAAPIVDGGSIDMTKAFCGNRYEKGDGAGDYINCPLNKDEYIAFHAALISAETAALKSFEDVKVFEGCMPVEVLAKRGVDSLRFGPLKPVGFKDESGKRPYAVVQLRKENVEGAIYNIVGFQTNLKFNEQKRVFSMIPALNNADFVKYGVMHRNAYINAPKVLSPSLKLKNYSKTYVAGQLSGVEGYMESIMTGVVAAMNIHRDIQNLQPYKLESVTMTGALLNYLGTQNDNFQPMNSNFGILPPLEQHIKDKQQRKSAYSVRALQSLKDIIKSADKQFAKF